MLLWAKPSAKTLTDFVQTYTNNKMVNILPYIQFQIFFLEWSMCFTFHIRKPEDEVFTSKIIVRQWDMLLHKLELHPFLY